MGGGGIKKFLVEAYFSARIGKHRQPRSGSFQGSSLEACSLALQRNRSYFQLSKLRNAKCKVQFVIFNLQIAKGKMQIANCKRQRCRSFFQPSTSLLLYHSPGAGVRCKWRRREDGSSDFKRNSRKMKYLRGYSACYVRWPMAKTVWPGRYCQRWHCHTLLFKLGVTITCKP